MFLILGNCIIVSEIKVNKNVLNNHKSKYNFIGENMHITFYLFNKLLL